MKTSLFDLVVPLILLSTAAWALYRRVDVWNAITTGAAEGLGTVIKIFPNLVCLLTAVYMLRASGAMEAFAAFLAPAFDFLRIPAEVATLMVVRPVSGSAALAIGAEMIESYGPDSLVGRTTMSGATSAGMPRRSKAGVRSEAKASIAPEALSI